jgi:hypothetical protein
MAHRATHHAMTSIVQLLPARARHRYLAMVAAVDDARALLAPLSERNQNLNNTLVVAESALAAADPKAPHVARLRDEVVAARTAVDDISAQRGIRLAALARAEAAVAPFASWAEQFRYGPVDVIAEGPGFVDVDVIAEGAQLRGADTWPAAIERLRAERATLEREVQVLRTAPPPLADVLAAIDRAIDAKAQAGRPQLAIAAGGQVAIRWPDIAQFGSIMPGAASDLLMTIAADHFRSMLHADAEVMIGDRGLPLAGREARIGALDMKIRDLAFAEETLIQAAALDGVEIARLGVTTIDAQLQIRRASPVAVAAE